MSAVFIAASIFNTFSLLGPFCFYEGGRGCVVALEGLILDGNQSLNGTG